jgi:pimeloyl-ACP methyl ester carboxylesterase
MTFRLAPIGLLLAVLASTGSAVPSQPAVASRLDTELRTGLDLCEPTPRFRLNTLQSTSLYFDTPNPHCWTWDDVLPGFALWASRTTLGGLDMPVVVGVRKGDPVNGLRHRILIRVIGGPGGSVAPSAAYSTLLNVLRPGDVLVTPAYPGTRHGTFYPDENFTPGSALIAHWLREVRRRNPDAEVVLVGESLGGPIALEANRVAGKDAADRIVLISPLAYSSADAEANFTQRRGAEYRNDNKTAVRVLRRGAGAEPSHIWQQVFSTDLFKTFFPKSERNVAIAARLRVNAHVPILLVYGTQDWRAGFALLEQLTPEENLRVVRIADMPHEVGAEYQRRVSAAVSDFLDSPRRIM